jgi:hypothetical protein
VSTLLYEMACGRAPPPRQLSRAECLSLSRRDFITLLGDAAAWPLGAHAQQREPMRRIGVLVAVADDPEGQTRLGVTRQVVMLWCRTRGWGYRLSPTTPWRIPRERLERILAERDAAARA